MAGRVFIIAGAPGAGKSTVAEALLQSFPFGFHINVDGLREMVVSGLASPLEWGAETERQFDLAFRSAAELARIYADADFAVAVEAVMDPQYVVADFVEPLGADRVTLICLAPTLDVLLDRNRTRTNKSFDTSVLARSIREVHHEAATADWAGWHVIDSSDQTVTETVESILGATA